MDKVNVGVSRVTLDAAPERALAFLRGVGLSVGIRRALFARGYTKDDHDEGWKLLLEASGFGDGGEEDEDEAVREAAIEIDAWDEGAIRIIAASLERRHREWSEIARVAIRRRDHLIRLGLANRRTGAAEDDDAGEALSGHPTPSAVGSPEV